MILYMDPIMEKTDEKYNTDDKKPNIIIDANNVIKIVFPSFNLSDAEIKQAEIKQSEIKTKINQPELTSTEIKQLIAEAEAKQLESTLADIKHDKKVNYMKSNMINTSAITNWLREQLPAEDKKDTEVDLFQATDLCLLDGMDEIVKNAVDANATYLKIARKIYTDNEKKYCLIEVEDDGSGFSDIAKPNKPAFVQGNQPRNYSDVLQERTQNSQNAAIQSDKKGKLGGAGLGLGFAQKILEHYSGGLSISNTSPNTNGAPKHAKLEFRAIMHSDEELRNLAQTFVLQAEKIKQEAAGKIIPVEPIEQPSAKNVIPQLNMNASKFLKKRLEALKTQQEALKPIDTQHEIQRQDLK